MEDIASKAARMEAKKRMPRVRQPTAAQSYEPSAARSLLVSTCAVTRDRCVAASMKGEGLPLPASLARRMRHRIPATAAGGTPGCTPSGPAATRRAAFEADRLAQYSIRRAPAGTAIDEGSGDHERGQERRSSRVGDGRAAALRKA